MEKSIKKGYKKTKIGVIPEDWELIKLGKLGELKNGINKDKDQFGFGYPMVNLNDVFNININSTENLTLVNSSQKDRELYSLIKGDVLFIRSSVKPIGVGLTALINNDLNDTVYSGFIIRFRSNNKIGHNYKNHCFSEENFRKRLLSKSTISANTNINQTALNSLQIVLPPLPEQEKIAAILSTWDEGIQLLESTIKTLKKRNKGLAQQLLTGKLRLRSASGEKFDGEWEKVKLNSIINFHKVKAKGSDKYPVFSSSKNGLIPQNEYYNGENRITSKNIDGFNVIPQNFITYRSRSDDGIFTFNKNKFDFVGVVSKYYPVFSFSNSSVTFLLKLLNFNKYQIGKFSVGTSQLVLGEKELKNIFLILPSLKEQEAIANVLETADAELQLNLQKLNTLQEQKKGLMQKLLTGEVRVRI